MKTLITISVGALALVLAGAAPVNRIPSAAREHALQGESTPTRTLRVSKSAKTTTDDGIGSATIPSP